MYYISHSRKNLPPQKDTFERYASRNTPFEKTFILLAKVVFSMDAVLLYRSITEFVLFLKSQFVIVALELSAFKINELSVSKK